MAHDQLLSIMFVEEGIYVIVGTKLILCLPRLKKKKKNPLWVQYPAWKKYFLTYINLIFLY